MTTFKGINEMVLIHKEGDKTHPTRSLCRSLLLISLWGLNSYIIRIKEKRSRSGPVDLLPLLLCFYKLYVAAG